MNRGIFAFAGAVAATALTVSACGSSGTSQVDGQGFAVLSASIDKTQAAKTARLAFTTTIATTKGTVTVNGNGAADLTHQIFELKADLPAGSATTGSITEIFTDGILYMMLPESTRTKTDGKPWISLDLSKLYKNGTGGLGSLNGSPTATLATLRSVSRDVQNLGPATIRGVKTTHYRADVDALASAKKSGLSQNVIDLYTKTFPETIPEDIYLDAQGRVARQSYSLSPKSDSAAASTLKSESVSMDLYDFGHADLTGIKAPPASETFDGSDLPGLSELFGG
jgi:hypothetical protein